MEENHQIAVYQQLFGLTKASFQRIDHEEAVVAIVYKVSQLQENPLILKISKRAGDYLREVYFLKALEGTLPIPRILQQVAPKPGLFGAILMEFLPGTLLKIDQLTASLAHEMGRYLALIHVNRMVGYGDPTSQKPHADPVSYFTNKFEEDFDECKGYLPIKMLDHVRHYFESNRYLLKSVDGPCIVHRDFRPGNLLIHNGRVSGIIDWAGARFSFAEEDFCAMDHAVWSRGPSSKISFLEGYTKVRSTPPFKPLLPLLRMSKALGTIGFTVKQGSWAGRDAILYQFNRSFLEKFLQGLE